MIKQRDDQYSQFRINVPKDAVIKLGWQKGQTLHWSECDDHTLYLSDKNPEVGRPL